MRAINGSRARVTSTHHTWITTQITLLGHTCMPLGTGVMKNVMAQLPKRMLIVVMVVVLVLVFWASAAGDMANAVAPITPAHSRT